MTFNFVREAGSPGAPSRAPAGESGARSSAESKERDVREADRSGPHVIGDGEAKRRALLVGNPNVGKSVLFGALTGTYVTVSNYPGTTVEVTRGRVALHAEAPGAESAGANWELLDTPGTNNLVPMSEDEAVTRDILLSEPSDVLVQVGDAKNLTRTLLLTLQLAELGVPFLLDLNMIDEARGRGIAIDIEGLERELGGVRVNTSAAIDGEGVEPVRAYLAERAETDAPAVRAPLPCAPSFPEDVEAAIAEIEAALPSLSVAKRGVATMLLSGDRGFGGWLEAHVSAETRSRAASLAEGLSATHGVPAFALLSKLRLARAQSVVRAVQRKDDARSGARAHGGRVPWPQAAAVGAVAAVLAGLVYDGALVRSAVAQATDPLDDYGFFNIAGRLFSAALVRGWTAPGLAFLLLAAGLAARLVHCHATARAAAWKLVGAFAVGYAAYWATSLGALALHHYDATPVHIGALVGLATLAWGARAGDTRDAAMSGFLGRYATHPRWGVPILFVVLFFAYKVVGVFGAGTAVDFLENEVFGNVAAAAPLGTVSTPAALSANDDAGEDNERLVALPGARANEVQLVAQVKRAGAYVADAKARIDVYPGARGAKLTVTTAAGETTVQGDLQGAEARVWKGSLNRWAYAFFFWLGIPFVTAFFVGTYGLLTMGVTYAVAIVLPVVTTFFFVFSMLEDSGYLPRLAVMANRQLRMIGLNGKAVLPMVLGLGCDTMATLTARIMETKKERVLVTLLLALGIPCSSQLSVIFAMMQRTSRTATLVWVAVVMLTIGLVGWVAAKVVPGDKSDFLMEMPPIRQPQVRNLASKTMARIEWYLREAVPLFLAGTALLFFLDFFKLLGWVHRAGEPVVHHLLGFGREGGASDRVSEALLVGFLRRDFGAAGLLDMARGGHLSTADVAVSMVVITLFIPCIANVFMIVKERGWKVAGMMSAFIFPYAVLVGGLVRLLFKVIGG
ncbi:MAG TPA: ferrous iron transporter B [Polyangiaceae bacterium]|jgi:Fe2+ transport system protein B